MAKKQSLRNVLPENLAVQTNAVKQSDIQNYSTVPVENTPPFNSHEYSDAARAKSGLAEHINLTTQVVKQQDLAELKDQFTSHAQQLRGVKLPDIRVNVGNIKMELAQEVNQYANDMNQGRYMQIIKALLGSERVASLKKHTLRANQNDQPALWLNQQLHVETKKPYVYTVSRDVSESVKEEGYLALDKDVAEQAKQYLQHALGPHLFGAIQQIANVNTLPEYTIFVILVDAIIQDHTRLAVPVTADNIWDDDQELSLRPIVENA
jgi:hypothetical protein